MPYPNVKIVCANKKVSSEGTSYRVFSVEQLFISSLPFHLFIQQVSTETIEVGDWQSGTHCVPLHQRTLLERPAHGHKPPSCPRTDLDDYKKASDEEEKYHYDSGKKKNVHEFNLHTGEKDFDKPYIGPVYARGPRFTTKLYLRWSFFNEYIAPFYKKVRSPQYGLLHIFVPHFEIGA